MRSAATCISLFLLAAAFGCGSAGFNSSSLQSTTPANISVSVQPVLPTSPAQVTARAVSPYPITQWQVFADSVLVMKQATSAPQITASLPLSAGFHQIAAVATNTAGNTGSASVTVNITGFGSGPSASGLAVTLKPIGSASPATVSAAAQGPNAITKWAIYVDSSPVYQQSTTATTVSQSLSMSSGQHQVKAQAWDSTGTSASATATVNITAASASGSSGGLIPVPPSSAKTWNNIEEMKGWSGCGACAGNPSGTGPTGNFWFKQGVSSPSLDGNSMETYIGGWVPWADNVFGYHFGPQNWANHIIYTVHFLWNAPKTISADGSYVVQAVEFDSYFSTNGFKYMFGTQCDYAGGYWGIWNGPANKWQNTSLRCNKFPPNQWHTITWYVERDQSKKKLHFVALAVDGKQNNIDSWMNTSGSGWGDDFGIQVQQDSDRYGSPWNMWVDQISATIW